MNRIPLQQMFDEHIKEWTDCQRCDLSENRQYVVHIRGAIPCDVLFIGEAPGESENCLGQPFIGPAGQLLDDILRQAIPEGITYALTNLVGCIPRNDEGGKLKNPEPHSIKECSQRLIELVEMCNPRLIVCVGKLAEEWLDKKRKYSIKVPAHIVFTEITHPAAIIRSAYATRPLSIKREVIRLSTAIRELK